MTNQQALFWPAFIEVYLLGYAWLGWAIVLVWLYAAITISVWATVPAAFCAVFWTVLAQEFVFGRR